MPSFTRQVCVDINVMETQYEEIFLRTRDSIYSRRGGRSEKGAIYERKSGLRGQEGQLLLGIASAFINGQIVGVDQVLDDGLNVAANIDDEEFVRLYSYPEVYKIRFILNLK